MDGKKFAKKLKGKAKDLSQEIFCFTSADELESISCTFFAAGYRGRELCQTINSGFQIALEELKSQKV